MKTIEFGNVRLDRIVELDQWIFAARDLFPSITSELLDIGKSWLDGRFINPQNNNLILGVHSFLIRTNNRTILVDTCNGNHKNRPSLPTRHRLNTTYLSNLARTGVQPKDVDFVVCTHLHPDHCGWNTQLSDGRWVPTFPNAKYLMNTVEFERVKNIYVAGQLRSVANDMVEMFADSILPIVQAKQAVLVNANHVVMREADKGIWLEDACGHTPGHVFVHVKCNHGHAILTGDAIHHPLQLAALNISNASDVDPALAATTRRKLVETYADTNTLILSGHFAGPTAGRIITKENSYRFRWLDADS